MDPPAGDSAAGDLVASDSVADKPAVRAQRGEPVLPAVTADESAVGWGDWREERDDDERFLREVPPHHGTY